MSYKDLKRKWDEHLTENDMTYWQHLKFAMGHGFLCLKTGVYLIVHSILPCYGIKSGGDLCKILNEHFTDYKKEEENVTNK